MIKDFSRCVPSGRFYTGAERKLGIQYKGENYIIKFRKNSEAGQSCNHISEYLGCHIFETVGIETQETWLGIYRGEEVVVLKDFTSESETFVPFNDVGDSSLDIDRERVTYSYSDITAMLKENRKLTRVEETVDAFWDIYIMDAFLGNFDRHGSNWGFLKSQDRYRLAPVFDNGSCLFPKLANDEQCQGILRSQAEMEKRIYQFPTSQIRLDGQKSSYYEVIRSRRFPACDRALERMAERIDMEAVCSLVESIEQMSDVRKEFLITMLTMRYTRLIREPLERR
ncbi:MAG: HipA domain-containing protein [Lachnospiraceae bacterium]|nr:HipA domain-containing protein [Lachnospiraceae bacterium]